MNKLAFLILFALIAAPFVSAQVTVSGLGYDPDQEKRVVVYTSATSGDFEIKDMGGNRVLGPRALSRATCQGNQPCLIGDFTDFRNMGEFKVHALGMQSPAFKVSDSVFLDKSRIFTEFFNALQLQGSSYHPDHHVAARPLFTMMQDGSFLHTTDMSAMALIRMGQAYEINPTLFRYNQYSSTKPDMVVNIKRYVDYLAGMQDYDGTLAMPHGWEYNFNCEKDYTLSEGKHNTAQDPCLNWRGETAGGYTASAFAAYMYAMPALAADYPEAAPGVLDRAIRTESYIRQHYGATTEPGRYGAGLFILYDFTGDTQYLQRAYDLRGQISTQIHSEWTEGKELYWHEYIKHRSQIEQIGTYKVGGQDPEQFFASRAASEWSAMSRTGDRVSDPGTNRGFHTTRPMLVAAIHGELARKYTGSTDGTRVSESTMAWLTGQNRVDWGTQGMQSKSFIFGIGTNGKTQHLRLVPPTFFDQGQTFLNGKKHIPGWTAGAWDITGDGKMDYRDGYEDWQFNEGTNHMTSLLMFHSALLDARLNGRTALPRPHVTPEQPPNTVCGNGVVETGESCDDGNTANGDGCSSICQTETTPGACYSKLNDLPVTCTGGTVIRDDKAGCRTVACSTGSGNVQVLACEKVAGSKYFEIYKQTSSGTQPQVCIGKTCLPAGWGYIRGDNFPICMDSPPACTPTTETCDGRDNDCDGQVDEGNVCAPTCTPLIEVCDGRDNDCDGSVDEGQVCAPTCTPTTEVCDGKDNDCDGLVDENNVCGGTGVCYNSVKIIPATCTGASITQDAWNGCRTITCGTTRVLACDKTSNFEMYKQVGGTAIKVCIGSTCIKEGGFAASAAFPICTGTPPPTCTPSTEVCDGKDNDCDSLVDEGNVCTTTSSVDLRVKDWYPQGRNYVFVCDESGYAATQYKWNFGDGQQQTTTVDNVYHSYTSSGSKTVSCTATGGGVTKTDTLPISVS
jgi:cysteine-rich repeat protein